MIWRALLVWLFLAAPAAAQRATVVSGEHAEFSRLVVTTERPVKWQMRQLPDGAELVFEAGPIEFALQDVFRLIPRTRVREVRAEGSTLRIVTAPGIAATAFAPRPLAVALDFAAAPAAPPASPVPPAPVQPVYDWLETAVSPSGSASAAALPLPAPRDLQAFETGLYESLGAAASSGLVEFARPVPVKAPVASPKAQEVAAAPAPPAESFGRTVHTAIDEATDAIAAPPRQERCLPPERLPVWEEDVRWEDVATLRLEVFSASGDIAPDGVTALARAYLSFGFGAEALAVLDSYLPGEEPILADIARAVEGHAAKGGTFAGLERCAGATALWAVLADEGTAAIEAAEPSELLKAAADLPEGLRRTVGERLALLYRTRGDEENAAHLERVLAQLTPPPPPPAAEDEEEEPAHAPAAPPEPTRETAAIGLARETRESFQAGAAIEPARLTELSALRVEHRGSAAQVDLASAALFARMAIGEYDDLPRGLAELQGLSAAALEDVLRLGSARMEAAQDDVVFAKLFLVLSPWLDKAGLVSDAARLRAADLGID